MPRHRQVTTCQKTGGPISNRCSCHHCTLGVCEVCGAYEGSLTTDCPGEKVNFDRQKEVYETLLDYTDERGWHQSEPNILGKKQWRRPQFEIKEPASTASKTSDPRTVVAPSIDWATVDRTTDLKHELAQKAIAWVLADRACDDQASAVLHTEAEIKARLGMELNDHDHALLSQLEREKIEFSIACRRVEKGDDEFRQVARRLVAELEKSTIGSKDHDP